ncbi:ABC transporter permease [Candidatus Mycoplasma mahonii]|uniref:ABC transporter permease n=1 Tax=Candidatus Mycoplasma mahonii TaxID=3004105 RepID=UPI0026ECDAAE|nr:ABC transporter permease [Candidatus Mycoplasma mahonii]WKX02340.1 ABC transporter permease [Candidatus Mycoplasma mahonii]
MQLVTDTPSAIDEEIQRKMSNDKKINNIEATQFVYKQMDYHPDWNVFSQLGNYLSNLFTKGDFGKYYGNPTDSIPYLFRKPLKWTLIIIGPSFLLGSLIGMIFGIFAGYKRGKTPDIVLNILSIIFVSVPSFVLAALVAYIASKNNFEVIFKGPEIVGWAETFKLLLLPSLLITITSFSVITYFVRNETIEVLSSDYISSARSKGLTEWNIFRKHVFRNISLPIMALMISRLLFVIFGSLIIEVFFGVPGISSMFATAITKLEINVLMFSIMFFTTISLLLSILIDVLYAVLDPTIRIASKESSRNSWIRMHIKRKRHKKYIINRSNETGG